MDNNFNSQFPENGRFSAESEKENSTNTQENISTDDTTYANINPNTQHNNWGQNYNPQQRMSDYPPYYGNGNYYAPPYSYNQQPSNQYQPYMKPQNPPKPTRTKKPLSKGFVIGAVAISIAISFVLNFFTCCFIYAILSENNTSLSLIGGGDDVIIQYAPKNENPPVITDKGSAAYVASLVSNTVVEVTTETVETDNYYGQYITQGAGSGVIVSSSETGGSYILTCAHVIDGANKITVKLKDGTVYEATSFASDPESDVGVIKLNVSGLPCATLGDFSKVVVGEEVVAIGNPLGRLGGSVTSGIVSALDRDIIIEGTTYHLLQTNAEINPGNSGGGLFNTEGHLIGIVNAKSSGENVEGLGFAIPIDDAAEIMTDLIEKGYVTGRVKLGFQLIQVLTQDDVREYWRYSRYFTDYGVYIITSENSNFKEGDRLVAINTDAIADLSDLKALLQKFEVGQTVSVTISRITNGNKVQMFTYELTLTEKKA